VLQEKLAAIPCRKLLLLDACHSGDVADSNPVRSLTPLGQGPVILAAADRMQVSLEDPGFGRQLRWFSSKRTGQGLFTYAVLIAMTGNLRKTDLDHNGTVEAKELYAAVRTDSMPALLRKIGKDDGSQVPIPFIPDRQNYPLAKVPPAP